MTQQENVQSDNHSNSLTNKQRMTIPRQEMPQRDGMVRNRDFKEVNLGMAEQTAITEARRCLQCKHRPCVSGCPVNINIPDFIARIAEGDFPGAAAIIRQDNNLPAVTGRVCPQEVQCEAKCVRGKMDTPVAIGWLERFVADYEMQHAQQTQTDSQADSPTTTDASAVKNTKTKTTSPTSNKNHRVACIGSGPAGITCAGELAKMGYDVTVFEALHTPGGVLVYGIPEFRLPNKIVEHEIAGLKAMGVKIETNVIVGRTVTIEELLNDPNEKFDAVFIANGAGLPVFLHIPGENLKGVYSANEYLTRVNLMGGYNTDSDTPVIRGNRVCVIGGGNTAMDAVRTSKRLGAKESIIVYRRARKQMPARVEEVHHAEEEGIRFDMLSSPVEILGNEDGWVTGLKCQRMELGEPDESGRRRPVPIPNEQYTIDCDLVIVAVGVRANPLLTKATPNLKLNQWGYIETDENLATSIPGVYAGGDIVLGSATVILAMGQGKKAARSIDQYLKGKTS